MNFINSIKNLVQKVDKKKYTLVCKTISANKSLILVTKPERQKSQLSEVRDRVWIFVCKVKWFVIETE